MAEYVEREALLKKFTDAESQDNKAVGIGEFLFAVIRGIIENQPTADVVEVRHGYWDDCECSVCGKMHPSLYLDEWELEYRIKETPYCPNCGAKMDGKGEGE